MRRFGFVSIVFLLILTIAGYILSAQMGVDKVKAKYRRIAPFSSIEMRFYDVSKTAWGEGLIFYRPVFRGRICGTTALS